MLKMASEKVKDIVKKFPGIFEVFEERKKVICNLTKHEIPLSDEALTHYTEGKKFKRLFSKLQEPESYINKLDVKYKEFFVPSKKSNSRLYCTLTKKEVNNIPHELEMYVAGYKFKKARYFFKQGKLEITPEQEEDENITDAKENDEGEDPVEKDDVPFYALSEDELQNEQDVDENNGNGNVDDEDEDIPSAADEDIPSADEEEEVKDIVMVDKSVKKDKKSKTKKVLKDNVQEISKERKRKKVKKEKLEPAVSKKVKTSKI